MGAQDFDLNNPEHRLKVVQNMFARLLSPAFRAEDYDPNALKWLRGMFDCPRVLPRGENGGGGGSPWNPIDPQPPCPPVHPKVVKDLLRVERFQLIGWPED